MVTERSNRSKNNIVLVYIWAIEMESNQWVSLLGFDRNVCLLNANFQFCSKLLHTKWLTFILEAIPLHLSIFLPSPVNLSEWLLSLICCFVILYTIPNFPLCVVYHVFFSGHFTSLSTQTSGFVLLIIFHFHIA